LSYNSKTNKTKKKGEKRKRKRKKEKIMETQRNQQGEMVDDQTKSEQDSQTLEERKKKIHWFRNSRITVLVVLVLLL
jgi:hypothetical protein